MKSTDKGLLGCYVAVVIVTPFLAAYSSVLALAVALLATAIGTYEWAQSRRHAHDRLDKSLILILGFLPPLDVAVAVRSPGSFLAFGAIPIMALQLPIIVIILSRDRLGARHENQ